MHPKLLGGSIFIDGTEVISLNNCDLEYKEPECNDTVRNFYNSFSGTIEVEDVDWNIDLNKTPDRCNIMYEHLVPVRKHKKKRIAKKWLKRYGQRTVQEVLENMKIVDCGYNTIEFIKEY